MEDDRRQDEGNTPARQLGCLLSNLLGAAVNSTSKSTGLAFQVELHVHVQQMAEGVTSDLADGALRDRRKDSVAHLAENS